LSKTWKVAKLTSEISSSPRKIRRALSCNGTFVFGATADAPPTMAKETPAAPKATAAFEMFRLERCVTFDIVKPPHKDRSNDHRTSLRNGNPRNAQRTSDKKVRTKAVYLLRIPSWHVRTRARFTLAQHGLAVRTSRAEPVEFDGSRCMQRRSGGPRDVTLSCAQQR
jgi:hypothetical protein